MIGYEPDVTRPVAAHEANAVLAFEGVIPAGQGAHASPVTLRVAADEVVVLVAPPGPGRAAMPRMLLGLDRPVAGQVQCLGAPVPDGPEEVLVALRRRMGWVPAQGALLSNLTLSANLTLPLRYHTTWDEAAVDQRRDEVLALLDLPLPPPVIPPLADRVLCRRVAVARALMLHPEILLLEELTDGMDVATARSVWATIAVARRHLGLAVLAVTGDGTAPASIADRVIDLPWGGARGRA